MPPFRGTDQRNNLYTGLPSTQTRFTSGRQSGSPSSTRISISAKGLSRPVVGNTRVGSSSRSRPSYGDVGDNNEERRKKLLEELEKSTGKRNTRRSGANYKNKGRRVGRNPTPGVPRKVGPRDREEVLKRNFDNPRRRALMRRLAAKRKKA